MYMNVQTTFIHISSNGKHPNCPAAGKQIIMVQSYNGTLQSDKKQTTNTLNSEDESQKCHVEHRIPDIKEYIPCDSVDVEF